MALANEIDKIVTWAQGEPVGVARDRAARPPLADVPSFALTDAWADRDPARLLDLVRDALRPLRQAAARHGAAPRGDARTAISRGCAS